MTTPEAVKPVVAADALRTWATDVLTESGLSDDDAFTVAACLTINSLRGLDGHGIGRLPIYAKRLQLGVVKARPNMRLERRGAAIGVLDGDNGPGVVVATKAMATCIEFAQDSGAAFVGVHNANHFAAAGFYTIMAAQAGSIGFAFCNSEAIMPPWGSLTPYFGTNPIAFATPARRVPHIVVDMATSASSWGHIQQAAYRGETIPSGWAIDKDGRTITNAARAVTDGLMVPMGGHKGSALALMVDVLAGVLTNAAFGTGLGHQYRELTQPQNLGFLFGVINIARFMPIDTFLSRVDSMIDEIRAGRPVTPGQRIYVPGEIEEQRRIERELNGIPLEEAVLRSLRELGEELDRPFPSGKLG